MTSHAIATRMQRQRHGVRRHGPRLSLARLTGALLEEMLLDPSGHVRPSPSARLLLLAWWSATAPRLPAAGHGRRHTAARREPHRNGDARPAA